MGNLGLGLNCSSTYKQYQIGVWNHHCPLLLPNWHTTLSPPNNNFETHHHPPFPPTPTLHSLFATLSLSLSLSLLWCFVIEVKINKINICIKKKKVARMSNKCKSEGKMGSKEKKYCGSKYRFQGLGFLNYKTFILRLRKRLTITISWIAFHSALQQEKTSLFSKKKKLA